jgi:CheY-like chemotaxis protein
MTDETPKRVLVVDDEPDVRGYLRSALEDAGFVVEAASDSLEALDLIRRNPPDLISLDLVMPRHSGAKLYRELQKDRKLSKIPVLIVTGHARDELGRNGPGRDDHVRARGLPGEASAPAVLCRGGAQAAGYRGARSS